MTIETVNSGEAIKLILTTLKHPHVQKETPSASRVAALSRSFGKWRRPHVSITSDGVIVKGIDYLAAVAASGKSVELEVERNVETRFDSPRQPLTVQLERAGIENVAGKLAIWRCLADAFGWDQRSPAAKIAKTIRSHAFTEAWEALSAVLESVPTTGSRPTRVRSKIAFGAFFVAYHASPTKVMKLYEEFVKGELDSSTPVGKLLEAVRHDNINTGSGRRPFLVKAAILLDAQLKQKSVDRATSSETAGAEPIEHFRKAFDK